MDIFSITINAISTYAITMQAIIIWDRAITIKHTDYTQPQSTVHRSMRIDADMSIDVCVNMCADVCVDSD